MNIKYKDLQCYVSTMSPCHDRSNKKKDVQLNVPYKPLFTETEL